MFKWLRKSLSLANFLSSLKVIKERPQFSQDDMEELQRLYQTNVCVAKMLDDIRYMASDIAIQSSFKQEKGTFSAGFIYAVFCMKQYFAGVAEGSDATTSVKQDATDSPSGVNRFIWKH